MSVKLTPYQRVQISRNPNRPYTMDYIKVLFSDFIELNGDRTFGNDMAVVCGFAVLEGEPLVIIGQEKGRTLEEKMTRNFGSMHPEGYRKALRCMKLAEKFELPVITFIDTSGAYPGIGAEERGQAEAIARNLREMSLVETPMISIVIGEGGSGGALGIGVADKLIMLENAYYSVISPEGCAAILFHDSSRAEEACSALKLTAEDLLKFGVADEIVPEINLNKGIEETATRLKESILKHISRLKKMSIKKLLEERYKKYRKIGKFLEKRRKK